MTSIKFNKEQLDFFSQQLGGSHTFEKVLEFYIDDGEIRYSITAEPILITTSEESVVVEVAGKILLIDTENLEVDGKKYFMHDEAMDIAKTQGKRLLTKKEYEELIKLPNKWDEEKKGRWFGELFFPACGYRNDSGEGILGEGSHGYYWSSSVMANNGYGLYFTYLGGLGANTYYDCAYGFSVRLVKDLYF